MSWMDEVQRELLRATEAERSGNTGKVRTSARRAAGVAIAELQNRHPERNYGKDFLGQLRGFSADPSVPLPAREAAERLLARLNLRFESPSKNPLQDVRIIIDAVAGLLQ